MTLLSVVGLLIASIVVLTACGLIDDHEEVDFKFDNRTNFLLCFERSAEGVAAGGCPQKIKPKEVTSGLVGCGYGRDAEEISLTVILLAADGERPIYSRTEECRVWQQSGGVFVIEQRDGEFEIRDSLPN